MRARHLFVTVVAATVLACTAGDETGDGQAPGTAATDQPSVEPRWTQVELPRDTRVSQARIAFGGGVLAGTERLPHMVAGVAADPGMPDQVRIWTSGNAKRWDTTDVAMRDGTDAQVRASTSDGRSTAVIGSTWTAEGGLRPFVLVSDDRQTWEEATLPEQASRRAVDPEAIALDADGAPLLVGTDGERRPVAVLVDGDGGGVVDLPAPDEGNVGFNGVAVDGDTVVAVAHTRPPDGPTYSVTFRSTDAGRTWRMQKGPGDGIAGVTGIARAGDHFVVTGWVSDDAGTSKPAAWQSADGRRWTTEDLDLPELSDLDVGHWPVAPAVRGNRLVAAMHTDAVAPGVLFDRDAAGRWTVRWSAERLVASETEGHAAAAPLADGTALVALWARNSGTIGVIENAASCDATCSWTTALDTIGPDDPGMEWAELVLDGDVPVVVGSNWVVTELDEFSWNTRRRLSRWSFVDDATVAPVAWDPPESGDLTQVKVASDGSGATAVLGTKSSPDERVADADEVVDEADVVGWFRPAPDAAWTPAEGLARRRYESLRDVFRVGDQWIAVGAERNNGAYQAHEHATVWASRDGVRWRYQDGPFDVAADLNSWADGACQLPGDGDTLVVGGVETPGDDDSSPVAWRHTDGGWTQVEQSTFDTNRGSLLSCTRHGDTTVVQGSVNGHSTLWRTTDGETFERRELSPSDASFSLVRPVTSGFAAAGTHDADHERGAVVWLSPDGVVWRAVAVPSDRRLSGWDVLDWDGRLVVAATSTSDPEIWILENASELLDTIDSGAPPDDGGF